MRAQGPNRVRHSLSIVGPRDVLGSRWSKESRRRRRPYGRARGIQCACARLDAHRNHSRAEHRRYARVGHCDRCRIRVTGSSQRGFSGNERFERALADQLLAPPSQDGRQSAAFAQWYDVIAPGTAQQFSVVAVDSNYYRYAVIGADPFGDDVRGNTLRGGVGLFGAVAIMTDVTLELVANREHPIEGDWVPMTASSGMPTRVRLYESPRFAQASRAAGVEFTGGARFANGVVMFVEATLQGSAYSLLLRSSVKGAEQQLMATLHDGVLTLRSADSKTGSRYRR